MTSFSPETAAAALLDARRRRRPIPLPSPRPASAADAFAVQGLVARDLGPAGAWKVGAGTAAPIAAALVRPSPCRWPSSEFLRIGLEVEIAFRLTRDLGRDGRAPKEDEIRAAIGSVHAAIEIVDSRFDTWPVPDPLWALADNQNSGGFVYGQEGRPYRDEPLASAEVRLTVDGDELFVGEGVNPGGEPFPLLCWLAAHAAGRGGLPAGTFVTTGSLTGIVFVEPGAEVFAEVAGLGRVDLALPR